MDDTKTSQVILLLKYPHNTPCYTIFVFPNSHEHILSRILRKREFCLCENKCADQLRSNCKADQRLCFHYTDSTIPLLLKSKTSPFYPSSIAAQADLCQAYSESPKSVFSCRGSFHQWTTLTPQNCTAALYITFYLFVLRLGPLEFGDRLLLP